jgi:hypothetical protein
MESSTYTRPPSFLDSLRGQLHPELHNTKDYHSVLKLKPEFRNIILATVACLQCPTRTESVKVDVNGMHFWCNTQTSPNTAYRLGDIKEAFAYVEKQHPDTSDAASHCRTGLFSLKSFCPQGIFIFTASFYDMQSWHTRQLALLQEGMRELSAAQNATTPSLLRSRYGHSSNFMPAFAYALLPLRPHIPAKNARKETRRDAARRSRGQGKNKNR